MIDKKLGDGHYVVHHVHADINKFFSENQEKPTEERIKEKEKGESNDKETEKEIERNTAMNTKLNRKLTYVDKDIK